MARSFNGSEWVTGRSAATQTGDITLGAFANITNKTASRVVICKTNGAAAFPQEASLYYDSAVDRFRVGSDADSYARATGSVSPSTSTWYHIGATYLSSSKLWTLYHNGASDGTLTNTNNPSAATTIVGFGNSDGVTHSARWVGALAECFYAAGYCASAEQMDGLAKGYLPPEVLGWHRVTDYAPFLRNLVDLKGNTLSSSGTSVSDHPRVIPLWRRPGVKKIAAGTPWMPIPLVGHGGGFVGPYRSFVG